MSERFVLTDIQQPLPDSSMSLIRHPLYRSGEPLLTQHKPEHEVVQTRSFLLGYAQLEGLDDVLDPDGRLIYKSDINPYNYHNEGINRVMGRALKTVYSLVQQSYLKGHEGDFNNHLVGHVSKVSNTADYILQESGLDLPEDTCDNARIAGMGHDIGGIIGRPDHAHFGALLTQDIFPKLLADSKRWSEICRGIVQHDEAYYRKIKGYGNLPFAERSRILRVTQSPLSAALVIADKSDVDRSRVYDGARNKLAMDRHNHSEVNMFTKDLGIVMNDESVTWNLEFNPYIRRSEYYLNRDLVIGSAGDDRFLAYSSRRVRNNPENPYTGINFEKIWKEMCFIYGPKNGFDVNRLELMVDSALTWFRPKFVINYFNIGNAEEAMRFEFTPENIDEQFIRIAQTNAEIRAKGL